MKIGNMIQKIIVAPGLFNFITLSMRRTTVRAVYRRIDEKCEIDIHPVFSGLKRDSGDFPGSGDAKCG